MISLLRPTLIGLTRLLVGAHARWEGVSPDGTAPRIYFANHTSHMDTLAVMAALPRRLRKHTHPVAALDYWGRTAWRRHVAVNCLNAVLLDRSGARNGQSPASVLQDLARVLGTGDSLLLFPEGTRGDGELQPFKSGLYHLARQAPQAELVPVYIENLYRVMPKGMPLPVPLICTLRFGAPLPAVEGEGKAAFLERARGALLSLSNPALRKPTPQRKDA